MFRPVPFQRISLFLLPKYLLAVLVFILPTCAFSQVTINTVTPLAAPVGATVTIAGNGFSSTPSLNSVFVGAGRATVTAASATALTITVPLGATYGRIIIVVNGTTAHSPQNFIVTGGVPIDANSYNERGEFPAGDAPEMIASTDFDGDGKPDIFVSNFNSSSVTVYRNTSTAGTVSFFKFEWHTEVLPETIAVDDINADGKPDLLITSIDNHAFTVFINSSTPAVMSLAGSPVFHLGPNAWPRGIATADLDGDGLPEAVTADANKNYDGVGIYGTISVMRNTSFPPNLNFAAPKTFRVGSYPRSLELGDLDGDSKPDAAVVNNDGNTVSVLRNTSSPGNIDFVTQQTLPINHAGQQILMGDIDGDGKKDLVVSYQSSSIAVFKNTSSPGNISFAPEIILPVNGVIGMSMGDLDGDGKPDLALASYFNSTVVFMKNTSSAGTISFASAIEYPAGGRPIDAHIGDIDGDGLPDLTASLTEVDKVIVMRQKPLPYTLNIGNDTSFCKGYIKQITASIPNALYTWSTGATTQSINVTDAGKYWVDVSIGSDIYTDTIEITVKPSPIVNLGNDTTICEGNTITLDATNAGASYNWSNGATSSAISVSQPGNYLAIARLNDCVAGDSIRIYITKPPSFTLGPDGILCNHQSLIIGEDYPGAGYLWQDGSTASTYTVTRGGRYELTVTNSCGSKTDDIVFTEVENCELTMPNAFTPNNDRFNDVFRVKYPQFITKFDMKIYNRYGEIIFQTTDVRKGWDGTYKGIRQPEGNFVWMVALTDIMGRKRSYKGLVLLLR